MATKIGMVVVLIAAIAVIAFWKSSGSETPAAPVSGQSFFSIDDGRTWFTAPSTNVPPFDHEGRPAYQVFVWTEDGGKTKFVSHLLRYTPEGQKRMREQGGSALPGGMPAFAEIKKAGEAESAWSPLSSPRAEAVARPKSSGPDYPMPVLP